MCKLLTIRILTNLILLLSYMATDLIANYAQVHPLFFFMTDHCRQRTEIVVSRERMLEDLNIQAEIHL